jgi:hypothetical protein
VRSHAPAAGHPAGSPHAPRCQPAHEQRRLHSFRSCTGVGAAIGEQSNHVSQWLVDPMARGCCCCYAARSIYTAGGMPGTVVMSRTSTPAARAPSSRFLSAVHWKVFSSPVGYLNVTLCVATRRKTALRGALDADALVLLHVAVLHRRAADIFAVTCE